MKNNEFMTIDELKRIAEENNYEFSKELGDFHFKKRNHTNYIDINGDFENKTWISIDVVCDDENDFNMIKASVKFVETPIDERGEEKKYYLKHRWLRCLGGCALLHESTKFHTFVLMGGFGEVPKDYKMKFTQKEIDEIKEKYNTDLSDFVMVEV